MNQRGNTRNYDLFKTIVALVLLIILILLLLSKCTPATPMAVSTETAKPPTGEPTATLQPPQPSLTPTAVFTETTAPSPTPTVAPTQAPTATFTPQPTTASTATETPAPTQALVSVDCPLALPTRLKVGDNAQVVANLNMRTNAGFGSTLILTNPVGTQLTIIGGPVCEPYASGAYLWWQVKRADGQTGWSAEGSITGKFYFLKPAQ